MSLLLETLRRHASARPEQIALSDDHRHITYAELPALVADKAEQLHDSHCRVLGIQADNSADWVLWDLATMAAGVTCVPLPDFFTRQQTAHVIQSAGIDHLVTAQGLEPTGITDAVEFPPETAKITFTSGTTGTPKGVCLSQHGVEQVAQSLLTVIGAQHAADHLSVLPLAILLENVAGVYSTLLAGARCHLYSLPQIGMGNPFQPDFHSLILNMTKHRITSAILVPELLRGLTWTLKQIEMRLPGLRFLAVGGSKVSPALLLQAQALGLPVYEGYGLSECGSVVSLNTPASAAIGSTGKVLPHIRLHCDNAGEIIIDNPALLGYLHGDRQTGAFATGDLGHLDANGFLHISGRRKNLLITSFGRNVSPEWVESALLNQPEIAQAVVYGDAQPWLGALLVPSAPQADLNAVVQRANASLPEYAKVRAFHPIAPLTPEDGMLTGTGRPRREAIANRYRDLIQQEEQQA
ncbi:AMP-binding protein [Candidatus Thiothrix sp. Deng01]|uniref:AMP-binding protein n=1 Tax=Candidatus Thiothrix phosphatis TaxID=3112415 RepID=A0ABU6CV35_9GAMM|nr:AMP-binding protein [Candidatus Thiothrix sp. Deng01]MEB4590639.1 AMP-binding protein [Candidatus Thiothrix sp. Deng01]